MFDQSQHDLRLKRAQSRFVQGNDFLLQRVVNDMSERLSTVNLEFENTVILFPRTQEVVDQLRQSTKINSVIRVEEPDYVGKTDRLARPDLLDLPSEQADLIIAPLTLHWSNDLPGTLIQLRQGLKPNGLMLASLPSPDTLSELRQSLLQAESEISGGAASRVDPFTDIRDAGALLQRAGFAIPVVDQEIITVRYNTVFDLINDLRSFGATLHLSNNQSPRLSRAMTTRMAQIYAERFADPDGRIRATFGIVSLSGWAPHESQQQKLQPGSAKMRLADALNVPEVKLKD